MDLQYIKNTFNNVFYIYKVLDNLHNSVKHDLTLDELVAAFYAAYPDANKDEYTPLFEALAAAEISAEAGDSILQQIKQRKLLLELSEKAYAATQGRASVEDIQTAVAALDGVRAGMDSEVHEFVSDDLEYLVSESVTKPGLRWRLNCLNKSLGSLRKGDFGFIFARPETGKTTFLASEISHMLTQTDKTILWFNNEEQGSKVMLRVYQAFFGAKLADLLANTKQYKAAFRDAVGGRFLLVDDANLDKARVERILQRCNPGLAVFDQLPKIKGFKADREDQVIGATAQWGRELAKEFCPMIGVMQAGATGEGKKWLTMDDVAKVKTEAQAEADFILGIGCVHEEGSRYVRYLNISKNKLTGDQDSLPNMRHAHLEVLIQPETARYKDIINYD